MADYELVDSCLLYSIVYRMKFFNNVNKLIKMKRLVFEKLENRSRKLVFDMGALPTIILLLLLFSTVGASIFFTKGDISTFHSSQNIEERGSIAESTATILIDSIVQDQSCFNIADGKIKIKVSGGVPEYSYLWSTGSITDNVENLVAGIYTVTVSDKGTFVDSIEFLVGTPPKLLISIDSISNFNGFAISCFEGNDGSIYTTPSGGTPPYTFAWSVGNGISEDANGLIAGNYEVTVTDANGCTGVNDTVLVEPTDLELRIASITTTDFSGFGVSCNGASDGQIKVVGSGGDSAVNYDYSWSTGISGVDEIMELSPGIYTVTLTDGNSCNTSMTITITEPDVLLISNTITNNNCFGLLKGEIDLSVSGGTNNYTYAWSTGATTQSISSLKSGDYTVTITDENTCQLSETYTIIQNDSISVTEIISDVKCFGGNNGAIT